MKSLVLLVGILAFPSILAKLDNYHIPAKGSLHFPANFSFGAATSAYQIEGAWNEDGKGMSMWDHFSHIYPEKIKDGTNGDVATDSYHRFDQDLELLKDLKVGHYRFSLAWERIFPNGEITYKNQAGVDYYNDVIDKLIANGITPLVTMHHANMPLAIQKRGGFSSPLIVQFYIDFAIELFKMFGDRVKNWITFNEPLNMCMFGYGVAITPPFLNDSAVGDYNCIHNLLKAHGAVYRIYQAKFAHKQGGKVGIALDANFFRVENSSDADLLERAIQFNIGYLAHPIFSKAGGYPEVMVKDIARNSREEGRFISRLPKFDDDWKNIIRGSADFVGLNYYWLNTIERSSKPVVKIPSFERDLDCEMKMGKSFYDPSGLEGVIRWLRKEYNNPPILITENGYRDSGQIEDYDRTIYLQGHLQAVLNAVNDGCNVFGYAHWSLLDNFEWVDGFETKLGLYAVNRTSPSLERYPKMSARFYKKVIRSRISPNKIPV